MSSAKLTESCTNMSKNAHTSGSLAAHYQCLQIYIFSFDAGPWRKRASSQEEKMDAKWGRARTNCNKLPINGKLPVLVSHRFKMGWCWCPAEKVGKLHHGPKYASSSRVGRRWNSLLVSCCPCQWGEPADKYQDVCAEIAPGASSQASGYEINMDAASNCTQSISVVYPNQNIYGRKFWKYNLAEPWGCIIKPPQYNS